MLDDLIHSYAAAINNGLLIVCAVVISWKSSTNNRYIWSNLFAVSIIATVNLALYSMKAKLPSAYITLFLWMGQVLFSFTIGLVVRSILYVVRRP